MLDLKKKKWQKPIFSLGFGFSVGKLWQKINLVELEWCTFKSKTKNQVQDKKGEMQSGPLDCSWLMLDWCSIALDRSKVVDK